jgi:DNA-directed RNA polymerase subunit E'/Rpb7
MYTTIYLDERVAINPSELNTVKTAEDVRDRLETKLKEIHEGKCNSNGYVRPGSLKLLAKSLGKAENGRFTGHWVYDCKASCEVLYPTVGSVLSCMIMKVNKMGVYATFEEAIRVLLPRDLHVGDETFDSLQEGQTIQVRLDRSRFQTKDAFIMAVGKLLLLESNPRKKDEQVVEGILEDFAEADLDVAVSMNIEELQK